MDREQAISIILANACCNLGNACELCPYGGGKEASKECKALKPDNVLLRQAIVVLNMKDDKKKFYFTFGSDANQPYQNTYLIVIADSKSAAIEKFRRKYPDRYENTYNAANCYTEEQWKGSLSEREYTEKPAEIIE